MRIQTQQNLVQSDEMIRNINNPIEQFIFMLNGRRTLWNLKFWKNIMEQI